MSSCVKICGTNISKREVSLLSVKENTLNIMLDGEIFSLNFADFPWFAECNYDELKDVTADRWGVYWQSANIDLSIESLKNPEHYPQQISLTKWRALRAKNRS